MIKSKYWLVVMIGWMFLGNGAQGVAQELKGSISYVSSEAAFMDLGRKSGIEVGDSVMVFRKAERLGLALVIRTSGSSSALQPADSSVLNWQTGDAVQVLKAIGPKPEIQVALVDSLTAAAPEPQTVFLDSAEYRPLKSARTLTDETGLSQRLSGYLSARVDQRGGKGDVPSSTNLALYGQFRATDLGMKHLDASVYIRSSESSNSPSSGTQIYSAMLEYANPASPLRLYLGRMYHPQFAMLGTVDGLGVSWLSNHRSLALLLGAETPVPGAVAASPDQRIGLIDEEQFSWGSLQIGSVSQFSQSEIARSYILLGSTFKPSKSLRVRSYAEFDLDPQDNSLNQDAVSLTNFRTGLNWRGFKTLASTLRYSYRENVVDLLDTAATEFELAARHSVNASVSWMAGSYMTLAGQASLRTDGSGRHIQIYGLSFNHRRLGRRNLNLSAGTMALLSYVSSGGRVYASLGHSLAPWLDLDLYDEVYVYKILGDDTHRVRHLPELSASAKVKGLNRLRMRLRMEQEGSDLFYRISLSASRQF